MKIREKSIVGEKSYNFALKIIQLQKHLTKEKEFILSRQILRSGTSIGANIEEALGASSEKDFLHKLNISYKEARETLYWIRLLNDSDYIHQELFIELFKDINEILRLLGKIRITMSKKLQLKTHN